MSIVGKLATLINKFRGTMILEMSPTAFVMTELDVTTRRSTVFPGTVATFPVEQGIDGADNFHRGPTELVCEGIISDTPVQYFSGLRTGPNRSLGILDYLIELQKREAPVIVFTDIRIHSDMVLENIAIDEDADTGDCVPITLTFRQSPILTTAFVPAVLDLDAAIAGAGGTVNFGTQSTVAPFDYTGPTKLINPF